MYTPQKMPFCFKYSDGSIVERYFTSTKKASHFAQGDTDHLVEWWAGRKENKNDMARRSK